VNYDPRLMIAKPLKHAISVLKWHDAEVFLSSLLNLPSLMIVWLAGNCGRYPLPQLINCRLYIAARRSRLFAIFTSQRLDL